MTGVPIRLRRWLVSKWSVTDAEGPEWDQVHDDYLHALEYGSPSQYLDAYLAACEVNRERPTPARYRTWMLNGERMARERDAREEREARRQRERTLTPEEARRERWNREWVEG